MPTKRAEHLKSKAPTKVQIEVLKTLAAVPYRRLCVSRSTGDRIKEANGHMVERIRSADTAFSLFQKGLIAPVRKDASHAWYEEPYGITAKGREAIVGK